MTWTEERVESLKKLWGEGLSASQIAAELGGITRNAVIGKVHRLGLSGSDKSTSSGAPRPRQARATSYMPRCDPRQYGSRPRLRDRGGGAGTDRQHHSDRPAPHAAGTQRADLSLA